ncbi:hypothetical protein [Shewanella baltica]|uniref:hypothetical protein n=1 Tax=Shewanella baltica TaxID=62322 RepID=UPI00217D2941|nr:hypothetical protein [Shewanella baltica]MCS6097471.1 hypothetical protein [Shewanella baltica]MCS6228555.1 hypothetical protein [Shewanella baltica]
MLRLRLSTEHHYAFKPSPCLKRVELPLNEQIFNTIGIIRELLVETSVAHLSVGVANKNATKKWRLRCDKQ